MDEDPYIGLVTIIRDRSTQLREDFADKAKKLEDELVEKVEQVKNDQVLSELKKLGARLDRLEAKLPDPEPEVE